MERPMSVQVDATEGRKSKENPLLREGGDT
jgi:hypothetical protein